MNRILGLLVLGLASALAALWLMPTGPWVPPQPVRPEIKHPWAQEAVPAMADLPHVLARPVFWQSRRFSEEPVQAAASGLAEHVRVLGLLGRGSEVLVIVRYENSTVRLTPGASLAGWRFAGVEKHEAVFVRPEEEAQRIPIPRKVVEELPRRGAP